MLNAVWRGLATGGFASLCLVTLSSSGSAQQTRRTFSPFIAGGFARSGGSAGGVGYNMQGGLDIQLPVRALRLRADGVFADWSATNDGRLSGFTGSVIATALPSAKRSPYLTAGLGGYSLAGNGILGGWMLGLGATLGNGIFAESRLHTIRRSPTDLSSIRDGGLYSDWKAVWMPFSVGVRF
jgi:hypothetical protein